MRRSSSIAALDSRSCKQCKFLLIFEPFAIKCCAMTQIYLLTSDHQHAVCGTNANANANANQLLCRKYQRRFFFEEVTFDHVQGKEKDQVSPMFISEHQRKTSVCRFCKITQFFCCFFFVISKVCWTVCVFCFLNLGSLKRIYASLFTSRDFRHRRAMTVSYTHLTLPTNREV